MYLFDPSLLQVVLGVVAALAVAYLSAWAATGGNEPRAGEEAGAGATPADPAGREEASDDLEPRQKAVLWSAAGALALFLLWWASLSAGSGSGGPSPL